MRITDVVGRTLGEAKEFLRNSGYMLGEIIITSPPKERVAESQDYFRVVRIKVTDENKIEFLVCKPR